MKNDTNFTTARAPYQTMIRTAVAMLLSIGLFAPAADAQAVRRNLPSRPEVRTTTVQRTRPAVVQQRTTVRTTRPVTRTTTVRTTRPNTIARTNRTVVRSRTTYRRPVYDARNPSWRYANVPRRNTVITTVPTGYRTVQFGGMAYRYYHGVFYRPYNNTFMVVAPPIGIYIDLMPHGYRRILVNNYPYYYYNGSYYQYRDSRYYVVSPPVGAIVESLPPGYETLTIDGETYYTVDGAQYKPVVMENGQIGYEVIKAN